MNITNIRKQAIRILCLRWENVVTPYLNRRTKHSTDDWRDGFYGMMIKKLILCLLILIIHELNFI